MAEKKMTGGKGQGLPRGKATFETIIGDPEDESTSDIRVERNPNDKRLNYLYQPPVGKFKTIKEASDYASELQRETRGMKKGGAVRSASSRADGIAQRGKTRGRMR